MTGTAAPQELGRLPLHDQLIGQTNDQINQLRNLVQGAGDLATISERMRTDEVPVATGLSKRLWRAISGGEAPVKKKYFYSKAVAVATGTEESGFQPIEVVGRWVNYHLNEVSVVGVGGDWVLSLELNEEGKVIKANYYTEEGRETRELNADELRDKLEGLGEEFKLDDGFIDKKIEEKVVRDFQDQGGEITRVDEIPLDAEVIELTCFGAEGREGTERVISYEVQRLDGEKVIVKASAYGGYPFPSRRDVLGAAIGTRVVEHMEEEATTS